MFVKPTSHDVALKTMNIAVLHAVEFNHRWTLLIIIEEVHCIASPGQMRYQLSVQGVVSSFYGTIGFRHLLLRPQAVVVVGEFYHVFWLGGE